MNSEKVKEIKNSIERKINRAEKVGDDLVNCVSVVALKGYLTLINELESERSEVEIKNNIRLALLNIGLLDEKKQLKDRIAELEKENAKLLDSVETVQNNRCTTKCELTEKQLKQFAERLKEKFNDTEYRAKTKRKTISVEELKAQMDWILHEIVIKNIDETLMEFIS